MENGVSSFNRFIHELSMDSVTSSEEYISGEEEENDEKFPSSPLSQASCFSRSSSSNKYHRHQRAWITCLFTWTLWSVMFLVGLPFHICRSSGFLRSGTAADSSESFQSPHLCPTKKLSFTKDHIVHCTTDKRRGVVEKGALYLFSPSEVLGMLFSWFSAHDTGKGDISTGISVLAAALGDTNPTLRESRSTFQESLNTDAQTCKDVITELGYPYEAISVVTADGYVLLLERIPRCDSQKVVYLQHGIMDSSMGYWTYSINEHGLQDIPAIFDKIHEVKMSEMKSSQPDLVENINAQPYKLCAIFHSLGGAVMLMYLITRRIEEKPHRLSRLILLSPAGFHEDSTIAFSIVEHLVLMLAPILAPIVPGLYIPTRFFRMLLNKLARDFQNYPALGGLVQTLMSYVVGGDSSNWVGAIGLSHYNTNNIPGVSFYVAHHLAQMKRARKFIMYDYGNEAANMAAYGSPGQLDFGQY